MSPFYQKTLRLTVCPYFLFIFDPCKATYGSIPFCFCSCFGIRTHSHLPDPLFSLSRPPPPSPTHTPIFFACDEHVFMCLLCVVSICFCVLLFPKIRIDDVVTVYSLSLTKKVVQLLRRCLVLCGLTIYCQFSTSKMNMDILLTCHDYTTDMRFKFRKLYIYMWL